MSSTDGKSWIVTKDDCNRSWGGGRNGKYFACGLCGYKFKEGDTVRWQYTNDVRGASGNPFVCSNCDGTKEEICVKRAALIKEFSRLQRIFHQDCVECQNDR